MIHFITEIVSSEQLALVCRFNTGEERLVDMQKVLGDAIHTPFFARLLNPEFFSSVKLDSYGTLCWNDEIDFCPDVLYENSNPAEIKRRTPKHD
jgi:hypothetical protein